MSAKIILISNFKGGVGKSTVSMHLAANLGRRGFRVLVSDCDKQATSSSWAACAREGTPFPAAVVNLASFEGKIHREIERHVSNYDFILIDTPPYESLPSQAALIFSHLCLIPLGLSPTDFWATMPFIKMVETAQIVNPNLRARLLPNMMERTALSKSILKQLEELDIPLMSSRLSKRIAFQEAVVAGTSVADLGRGARRAEDELNALTDEVLTLLGDE